jgi:enoyl-CoA hydratase/carnithine racemase
MPADESYVRRRVAAGVGYIILDRPPLNIITTTMARQVAEYVQSYDNDNDVRLIAVTAAGNSAFAAGSDIGEHSPGSVNDHATAIVEMVRAIVETQGKPRVAVVNGICVGGGCEVAFACDLVVASDRSRFAIPEIKLGVMGVLSAYLVARRSTASAGLRLAMRGDWIDAQQASDIGLIDAIFTAEEFDQSVDEYLAALAAKSGPALAVGRKIFWSALAAASPREALDQILRDSITEATATQDYAEGISAFLEHRAPRWSHR